MQAKVGAGHGNGNEADNHAHDDANTKIDVIYSLAGIHRVAYVARCFIHRVAGPVKSHNVTGLQHDSPPNFEFTIGALEAKDEHAPANGRIDHLLGFCESNAAEFLGGNYDVPCFVDQFDAIDCSLLGAQLWAAGSEGCSRAHQRDQITALQARGGRNFNLSVASV